MARRNNAKPVKTRERPEPRSDEELAELGPGSTEPGDTSIYIRAAIDLAWAFDGERTTLTSADEQGAYYRVRACAVHRAAVEGGAGGCPLCKGLAVGLDGLGTIWETFDPDATCADGTAALVGLVQATIVMLKLAEDAHRGLEHMAAFRDAVDCLLDPEHEVN